MMWISTLGEIMRDVCCAVYRPLLLVVVPILCLWHNINLHGILLHIVVLSQLVSHLRCYLFLAFREQYPR